MPGLFLVERRMATAMELTKGTYLVPSGSNTGLIVADGKAIIVDAGLDADTARRVGRALTDLGAKPVALLLTHAHADHFGGASAIAERFRIPVYAPALEAAVVENPYLEPPPGSGRRADWKSSSPTTECSGRDLRHRGGRRILFAPPGARLLHLARKDARGECSGVHQHGGNRVIRAEGLTIVKIVVYLVCVPDAPARPIRHPR